MMDDVNVMCMSSMGEGNLLVSQSYGGLALLCYISSKSFFTILNIESKQDSVSCPSQGFPKCYHSCVACQFLYALQISLCQEV